MNPSLFQVILLGVIAFTVGAVPFGLIAGRLQGIDLREHGSKNIGATNTLRVLGKGPGIAVLLLDALKGFIPVYIAQGLSLPSVYCVLMGLLAILGHIYSPFVGFRGGKGVATSLGVLIALSPVVAGISALVFLATVTTTRWVSLGSITGAVTQALLFLMLPDRFFPQERWPYQLFSVVAALFVVARHRSNIERLMAGTESRFGEKSEGKTPEKGS